MLAPNTAGVVASDQAAPERHQKDDAPELGSGAGIEFGMKEYKMTCPASTPPQQVRLAWEAEFTNEAVKPSQAELAVYAAAHDYWIALDTLAVAKAKLLALDNRPLPPDADRRRRRGGSSADSDNTPRGVGLVGTFPPRHRSVRAETLQRLLEGEELDNLDAVFSSSTTRLADHVFCLREMDWPIRTGERIVHTKDGRTEGVAVYTLPRGAIAAAMTRGGAEFCTSVREARAKQRAGAAAGRTRGTR